jgi:hypothetical protein
VRPVDVDGVRLAALLEHRRALVQPHLHLLEDVTLGLEGLVDHRVMLSTPAGSLTPRSAGRSSWAALLSALILLPVLATGGNRFPMETSRSYCPA